MSTFDTEAESLQRQLADVQAMIAERDSLRSKGGVTTDLVSKLRSGITKSDRLLEKITEKITAKPEGGGAQLLVVLALSLFSQLRVSPSLNHFFSPILAPLPAGHRRRCSVDVTL